MATNRKNSKPGEPSSVEAPNGAPDDSPRVTDEQVEDQRVPAEGVDLKPADPPPAAAGESPEEAAQPDSVSRRLIESNLEANPRLVKPEVTDPAPPPDKEPHPAEKIFRDAEEQLQDLLDSGLPLSDIELVTDSVGRLIEARRIQL